ncbi:IS1595 family transposase [Leifsonia bigeumensis]|uniref:IS1595 family transposase n=1 Tax=Leifsonella bigeumensis TaxID=433643 RepID=A0ABP7F8G6_9MICO
MSKQEFSIPKLVTDLKSEADAYLLLEQLRWGGTPDACPKCGTVGRCYFLNPANGSTRKTRTGSVSERRVWKCGGCRKQFSVLTDTIFHGTKISIRTWLMVILQVCSSKNSVSAWEISRQYGLTPESAWHMVHRIREAMKREPVAGLLRGAIQADETWIGGNPANRHRNDPRELPRKAGTTDKQPVFALVHYETREARSTVVNDVTANTLGDKIREWADIENTYLQTDKHTGYIKIGAEAPSHEVVDHSMGQYKLLGGAGTNLVEGFFSELKRSLDGTHRHVSIEHLDRYLAQFDFMFTTCKLTDSQRMRKLIGTVAGRRLTYMPLVGNA